MRADERMELGAETYRVVNAQYDDNWENLGAVLAALFPAGVTITTPEEFSLHHIFGWGIGKLTRFVNTGMTHEDSIHDAMVYFAMVADIADRMGRFNVKGSNHDGSQPGSPGEVREPEG